jgi:sterol desaturase/sphingolipid hydroxylase (fatty acid hydroxylase superfamily)
LIWLKLPCEVSPHHRVLLIKNKVDNRAAQPAGNQPVFPKEPPVMTFASIAERFGSIFVFFYIVFLCTAGGAYWIVWGRGQARFAHRRIQAQPRSAQPWRELFWSTLSIMILSALLTFTWFAAKAGWSLGYFEVERYGVVYLVVSVFVLAFLHDSYYYWAHRLMHHRRLFRYVHKLHHGFTNPTPFASYAFHPFEAMIEVAWFAPVAFVLPVHPVAVAAYIVLLTVLNVISHLGYEFYPPGVARWFITSTHHNMHHTGAKGHFMLYFNLWDKWLGTNAPDYHTRMEQPMRRAAQSPRG